MPHITSEQLLPFYPVEKTASFAEHINHILATYSPENAWAKISREILSPDLPFEFHLLLFSVCYPKWHVLPDSAPAWFPDPETIKLSNLINCMEETKYSTLKEFHAWSTRDPNHFWQYMITRLGIQFYTKPLMICDVSRGDENPDWLKDAKFNITDSCFKTNPTKIAIVQQKKHRSLEYFSYEDLNWFSNRIANSLVNYGFTPGDALAIALPMNFYAVAIYLGIIKMGGIVVSIADSFSSEEIELRLQISNAKAIFTQDSILRDSKMILLYEKIAKTAVPLAIVFSVNETLNCILRKQDVFWKDFLVENNQFNSHPCDAKTSCNILFSSGTTGIPKAIPWTHATAIKAASDACLNQDIHENDILAWPTNLGWMMGPWLIFAAFINNATLALYEDSPRDRSFGEFIQDAKITLLGVVPTLVNTWRQSSCMQGLNWHSIKCFSSTGECSNPEDMLYLMMLAGYKPIIEYCGGTEIGGAYVSSTILQNNYPSIFTMKAFGLDFVLLDEEKKQADTGEVALIPPSLGLSLDLLNTDHHQTYFADMPCLPDGKILRRHGDQLHRFPSGHYTILGRVDDTMNLGGIKISSAEIERVLTGIENIIETAAIGITLNPHGASCLVIFVATAENLDKEMLKKIMQKKINERLNPLFKIHDIVLMRELPKTASNKIMRKELRKQYQTS